MKNPVDSEWNVSSHFTLNLSRDNGLIFHWNILGVSCIFHHFPVSRVDFQGVCEKLKRMPKKWIPGNFTWENHGNITILICKSNFRGHKSKERCRETSTPMISIHIVYRMMAPSYVGWFITPFFLYFMICVSYTNVLL